MDPYTSPSESAYTLALLIVKRAQRGYGSLRSSSVVNPFSSASRSSSLRTAASSSNRYPSSDPGSSRTDSARLYRYSLLSPDGPRQEWMRAARTSSGSEPTGESAKVLASQKGVSEKAQRRRAGKTY